MKLIKPSVINDAALISSTVVENDYPVYAAGTTYGLNAYVIMTSTHRIYKSLQAANTGHTPSDVASTWWVDAGPTNKWAMFDGVVGTQTSTPTTLTVVLAVGRMDSISLLNIDAADVSITVVSGATTVYSYSGSLVQEVAVLDWYQYFMNLPRTRTSFTLTDLPIFGDAVVTITLSKTSGTVACGLMILGLQEDLGLTQYSPKIGINDFSRKTADAWGNYTLDKREFSKRLSVTLEVQNIVVDALVNTLELYRSTPVVWIGHSDYSSMTVYGFYKDFEVDIRYFSTSSCSLSIEGMI